MANNCVFEQKNSEKPSIELFYQHVKFDENTELNASTEDALSQFYFHQMNKYKLKPIIAILGKQKFRCIREFDEESQEPIISCYSFTKSNKVYILIRSKKVNELSLK